MKRTILLLAVLLLVSIRTEASPGPVAADSLRAAISLTEGEERLETYNLLVQTYMMNLMREGSADSLMVIFDQQEAEAKRQGNTYYGSVLRYRKTVTLYNLKRYDELVDYIPDALRFIAGSGQWRHYYLTYAMLPLTYRRLNEPDKAMNAARAMYDHAHKRNNPIAMGQALIQMGYVYADERRFKDQEKCLRESIALISDSILYISDVATASNNLISSLIGQKRYDDALVAARQCEEVNRRYDAEEGWQYSAWLNLWISYANLYRYTHEWNLADSYIQKIDSVSYGRMHITNTRAHVLYGLGRYDEAIHLIDSVYRRQKPDIELTGIRLMAILARNGQMEALDLLGDYNNVIDSVYSQNHSAELDHLRAGYELDRHIAEKTRNRNYYLFASGLCVLLVLLLAGAVYYNRSIAAKNRRLYRQIKENDRLGQATPDRLPTAGDSGQATEEALVDRLCRYLHTDGNLTREDITRDDLTVALGTNRNTLSEAVKAVTGKTLMEYIRTLQIEEARLRLDSEPDANIDVIAMECGLTTNTFYRLFKKHYGMSPTAYRKLSREA